MFLNLMMSPSQREGRIRVQLDRTGTVYERNLTNVKPDYYLTVDESTNCHIPLVVESSFKLPKLHLWF